jgi:hypothetical protein
VVHDPGRVEMACRAGDEPATEIVDQAILAMPTPLLAIHLHKDYVTEIELSAETTWPAARERA